VTAPTPRPTRDYADASDFDQALASLEAMPVDGPEEALRVMDIVILMQAWIARRRLVLVDQAAELHERLEDRLGDLERLRVLDHRIADLCYRLGGEAVR
jgi:hypothetical protein